MKWPVRELSDPDDIRMAAAAVTAWGFPRPIHDLELEFASWFRMGAGIVWWYEPVDPERPLDAVFHLAVDPAVRSRWPVRRWQVAAEVVAELMGSTRLVFTPWQQGDTVTRYAERIGFVPEGDRYVRHLGGEG